MHALLTRGRRMLRMNPMKLLICATLAITATSGVASAQQQLPPGRVYAFHSSSQGNCPALDWHVVLESGGTLVGMIPWNNMQSMARATGSLNTQTGAFQMKTTEVGGQGRTATIDGTVNPDDGWLTANIQGPGVKCQSIKIPWLNPYRG
jgi:hypothetical protein